MSFTKEYRGRLIGEVRHRFKCYWHAVHPVIFNPNDLYRLAFSKEEWSAMMLLRERFRDTLKTGYRWLYMTNETDEQPKISLEFSTDDEMPGIELNERDVPDALALQLRAWAVEAKRLDDMDTLLSQKLRELVRIEFQGFDNNERRIQRAIVNTPGTMHRVWPEVLPFLDNQSRDTMKQKSMKSPMPKSWDDNDYNVFHEGPEMEELTLALIAMALLPETYDKDYPTICY